MAQLTGPASTFEGSTSDVHSSAKHVVGTRAFDKNGNEYVYLQGTASVDAGSWVIYDLSNSRTSLLGAAGANWGPVAIAGTTVTAGQYGFFQVYGINNQAKMDTTAANKQLYIDATAGRVDDADAAGSAVIGAISLSADASNVGTVFITYPHVNAGAAID